MADETNVVLLEKLYSKLADALAVGTPSAMPGQNYLALCNPGILLEPTLDLTRVANQATWSAILDNIPEPNWVYAPTNSATADAYKDVLEGKELPIVELTDKQKEQLENAREVLFDVEGEPSIRYRRYVEYESKYYTALTAYLTARATSANTGASMPPGVEGALNRTSGEWNTFGHRAEVENAQATINNLQQLNPNRWWKALEDRYSNNTVEGPSGKFHPVTTYPGYPSFMGETGWTSFSFNQADVANQANSSAVSAGGGVSASWGLWRVSASANYSKETSYSSSNATNMVVSMEMMRATLLRPWLDPLVFRAQAWRFSQAMFPNQLISSGTFIPGQMPANTLMPLLPTGVLIARNVSISGTFSHEDQTKIAEAAGGETSVGWGPFAISGHYNQSSSSDVSHASTTNTSIANQDAQIIGFFCDVLPMSPNPDPRLHWPS